MHLTNLPVSPKNYRLTGATRAEGSKYRPEVDGLRALAILPVLLFHANLGFPGGFVGVDVFFVISGFLITSLILKEIAEKRFSLVEFWERRIRRIFPAMVAVVLAVIVTGYFLYLPTDFVSIGKTVIAQAVMMANFFFALHTGYFEDASDTKPLLHTWSLAVEEQFYIFFPLLLMYLAASKKLSIRGAIISLGVVSLFLSIYGTYSKPDATFYMLPTRAWELLAGAFLAATPTRLPRSRLLNEIGAVVGLVLVLCSIFLYNRETRFPGIAAVPPCLGACLIIFFSHSKSTLVGRALSWKPIVFIGLISYSLYLWHWPILVFSKYIDPSPQSWLLRITLLAASVVLASLSWKFIETPFRKKVVCSRRRQIFTVAGTILAIELCLGATIIATRGGPARLNTKAQAFADFKNNSAFLNEITLEQAVAGKFVDLGTVVGDNKIQILVWGDSHAMAITPAIDTLCRRFSVRGVEATHSATAPLLGYISKSPFSLREKSPEFSKAVMNFILRNKIKKVVIAAVWTAYGPPAELDSNLCATARVLVAAGVQVCVLKDVPMPGFDVPRHAALKVFHGRDVAELAIPSAQYEQATQDFNVVFEHLKKLGAIVLDPTQCFASSHGFDVVRDNNVLYRDWHHLSVEGAKLLIPIFEPLFVTNSETKIPKHAPSL
jgi:peptidoglycan/LPS O-acetylase OafA/YrhL